MKRKMREDKEFKARELVASKNQVWWHDVQMYEGPSAVLFENFLKHSSKVEPYCLRFFSELSWWKKSVFFLFSFIHLYIMSSDLFTTTFSPYLLRFFTVNYALRLNLTIPRLNKHRFFQNSFVQKGTYRDWNTSLSSNNYGLRLLKVNR
jgi:hypothetical protein